MYITIFHQVKDTLVKFIKCVINLVTDMDDQLYQMLLCDENAGDSRLSIQARFVAKKQKTKCYNSNLRHVFFTEVIPHPNAAVAG